MRFRVIFILLVLILLVVSALFGLLTYWLDAEVLPASTPGQGSMAPVGNHPNAKTMEKLEEDPLLLTPLRSGPVLICC